jgi:hypothetical protein
MVDAMVLTRSVRPRRNTQNLTQSERFQRGEGREDQGGYCQVSGELKPYLPFSNGISARLNL